MADIPDADELSSSAVWSNAGPEDSAYRYRLQYRFPNPELEDTSVGFVMMNPSYASETQWDNTVRRCAGYAYEWGYSSFDIGNIFAFRTPFPEGGVDKTGTEWPPIWEQDDPVGPENDKHLRQIALDNHQVVCAWGNAGAQGERGQKTLDILSSTRTLITALKVNKTGHPAHPLYLPKDLGPKRLAEFENFRAGDLSLSG